MKKNQDRIEELNALLKGLLKGKQKKALLDELQKDAELFDMFYLLQKMAEIAPNRPDLLQAASKKLSKTLYKDFLKEQASSKIQIGVQVFDSSLLPLPKGVRPAAVDTRQLKYQLGQSVVELSIYPVTIDSVEIIGQINGLKKNQKLSVTAETKSRTQRTSIDEFCLFRFERVAVGDCRLLFSSENIKESIIELSL